MAVEEFQSMKMEGPSKQEATNAQVRKWEKPPLGWFKINCDAALDVNRGLMGVGAVIRDHRGTMIAVKSITQRGFLDPTTAEAHAALIAVQFCQASGVQKIILEGDAQTIINDLNRDGEQGSRYGQIIEDTKLPLLSFTDWRAQYVGRNENSAAHRLAKLSTTNVIDKIWRDVAP